jgi:hypothetical protein
MKSKPLGLSSSNIRGDHSQFAAEDLIIHKAISNAKRTGMTSRACLRGNSKLDQAYIPLARTIPRKHWSAELVQRYKDLRKKLAG